MPVLIRTLISGSSTEDEIYANINGRAQSIGSQYVVSNHKLIVTVRTRKLQGSGLLSRIVEIDSNEVITDENGNFILSLKTDNDAFATITHTGNENH